MALHVAVFFFFFTQSPGPDNEGPDNEGPDNRGPDNGGSTRIQGKVTETWRNDRSVPELAGWDLN